ncbi:MAG: hypothetical protein Q9163_006348 [Psora crenata]
MEFSDHKTINDGDFDVEYMPLEGVERLERYRPGGFHPIAIGDYLHRYLVVHKLGSGGYSTTWLARDQTARKYVAIKVAVAEGECQESNILHRIVAANLDNETHPGKAIIPPLLDEFIVNGPNGKHRCIATLPGMMSLAGAKSASSTMLFQLPVARAIAAQLIQAVAFLHSQGIVHADIHPGNILLRLSKSLDSLSPDEFYEKYGEPYGESVVRLDNQPLTKGVPTHGIMPVWLGESAELIPLSKASIFLTDFGESFLPSTTPRHYSNTPEVGVPPEVHFLPQEPLSFPSDIWTLACTIWTIIGQRPLFEGFYANADSRAEEHVDVFGKLPPEWWGKWDARSRWFNEDGSRGDGQVGRPWAERFEYSVQEPRRRYGMEEVGDKEKAALFVILKAMMAFRPWERPTAQDTLESEWMRKWALPELKRIEKI